MAWIRHTAFLAFMLFCVQQYVHAQQPGKITVKKRDPFVKAVFDDTNYKVIAMDEYGNPHEEAIQSFVITYAENGNVYEAKVAGNTFPEKTINYFTKKRKTAVKICLIKIVAKDRDGHFQDMPELCDIVLFPDCKNVKKN